MFEVVVRFREGADPKKVEKLHEVLDDLRSSDQWKGIIKEVVLEPGKEPDPATVLVLELREDGSPVPTLDVLEDADELGISRKRVYAAFDDLGWQRGKMVGEGGPWYRAPTTWFDWMYENHPHLLDVASRRRAEQRKKAKENASVAVSDETSESEG